MSSGGPLCKCTVDGGSPITPFALLASQGPSDHGLIAAGFGGLAGGGARGATHRVQGDGNGADGIGGRRSRRRWRAGRVNPIDSTRSAGVGATCRWRGRCYTSVGRRWGCCSSRYYLGAFRHGLPIPYRKPSEAAGTVRSGVVEGQLLGEQWDGALAMASAAYATGGRGVRWISMPLPGSEEGVGAWGRWWMPFLLPFLAGRRAWDRPGSAGDRS